MKSIVYIDMDDVLCDFTGAYKLSRLQTPGVVFPQSQYGFFTNLVALPNAIESVKTLIRSESYDPYILTAPSVKNPLCYTEKRVWIEQKFGIEFVKKLIISPNKSLLKGDFLIDDNRSGKGQEGFEGELIHFGSDDFLNWISVMEYLESKE